MSVEGPLANAKRKESFREDAQNDYSMQVLTILENKVFHKAVIASLSELTSKDQIIAETKWTDCLQNLVDFGNKRLLRNFSLRLEMDDCEPEIHRQCIYSEKEVNQ